MEQQWSKCRQGPLWYPSLYTAATTTTTTTTTAAAATKMPSVSAGSF